MPRDLESKIVFKEGEEVRVYRGKIIAYDGDFVTIKRRDGIVKINKSVILKIESKGDE